MGLSVEFLHVPQSITKKVDVFHPNTFVDPSSAVEETVPLDRASSDVFLLEAVCT